MVTALRKRRSNCSCDSPGLNLTDTAYTTNPFSYCYTPPQDYSKTRMQSTVQICGRGSGAITPLRVERKRSIPIVYRTGTCGSLATWHTLRELYSASSAESSSCGWTYLIAVSSRLWPMSLATKCKSPVSLRMCSPQV